MEATLQKIFRSNFKNYQANNGLSLDQHKAAQAIMSCQQDEMGYEEWSCENEDYKKRINHSFRHRSYPRCHGAQSHEWLEKIKERLLPCDHHHVVFTLPHELNIIWQFNREWSAGRLFKAAAECLKELLIDQRHLGGEVGLLSSLHTWGRTLSFHPHLHVLVTGKGLAGDECVNAKKTFLVPIGCLKAKFRGKWLNWLWKGGDKVALRLV